MTIIVANVVEANTIILLAPPQQVIITTHQCQKKNYNSGL